jgi:hypothetical protein
MVSRAARRNPLLGPGVIAHFTRAMEVLLP